jgi:hypothetical protein
MLLANGVAALLDAMPLLSAQIRRVTGQERAIRFQQR